MLAEHNVSKQPTFSSLQGASKLRSPVALDIFENNMFYVNAEDGAVMQMDKFGRGVPVIISSGYVLQEI